MLGQPGTVTTIAGQFPLGDGGPAMEAAFYGPGGLARDSKGNVYVLETNRLRRISPDGVVTTYAGTGLESGPIGDGGPVNRATLASRRWNGLIVDGDDNIYFSDGGRQRIRKISASGTITTLAGTGESSFSGDGGPATEARLNNPLHLVFDREGGLNFIDGANLRLRRIRKDGIIETIAGKGVRGPSSAIGTAALDAQFDELKGIALDSQGRVLLADLNRVMAIDAEGKLELVAGGGTSTRDGAPATEALFPNLFWITTDPLGNPWIANAVNMRRVNPDGTVETVLGDGSRRANSLVPGERMPAKALRFTGVWQPLWLPDGGFLFSEGEGQMIYRCGADGMVERFAGVTASAGADGASQFARVSAPTDVLTEQDGTLHVLEDQALRYITANGSIQTRWAAALGSMGLALAPNGDLIVTHPAINSTIGVTSRQTNVERFIAATESRGQGFSGDGGPAIRAQLNLPYGVTCDAAGNIFFADWLNHRIRKIDVDGIITTVAGNGIIGFAGDNGPGINAALSYPMGVTVGPDGTLYIADTGNRRIRTVDQAGIIRTFAEPSAFFGNGNPNRLALAPDGSVIVTDTAHRIHRISPQGTGRVIGGTGVPSFSGDGGSSTAATFNTPTGVTVDANGNIYIADTGNNRIRMIRGISTVRAEPRSFVFAYALGAPAVSQTLTLFAGDDETTQYRVTTNVPWLSVTPASGELTQPSVALRVTASAAGLGRGAYQGRITILNVDKGDSYEVPVSMIISGTPQQLRLDRTGLTFATMANGATLTQSLRVLNTGTGAMPFTALGSTTSGGAWLRVSPGSGQSTAGATAPALNVSVDPTGLAPGAYFGLVTVNAPNVDNAPQSAVVVLNVFPNDAPPGAQVSPYGLVFTTPPEGRPANQNISLSNPSNRALTYTATLAFPDTRRWFTLSATTGSIAAGQSAALTVTPAVAGIPTGIYRGTVQLRFAPDNTTQTVDLILVVATGSVLSTSSSFGPRANGCIPRRLVPLFRAPGAGFRVTAGWPEAVEVLVADDCGDPVSSGRVTVTFSTNDPPLQLTAVGNGRWTAAWTARTVRASNVAMVANVQSEAPRLEARTQITGGVVENRLQPLIDTGGVVSLASLKREQPVATNSLIAVLGTRFSAENQEAPSTPWPTELLDTRASIAGRPIPLRRTSEGRIEALLPLGVPEFTTHQMIVQRGRSYSPPESVLVTAASPAVFTADESGSNQGSVYIQDTDGRRKLASEERPVSAGDLIEIEATGLGMTDPVVPPGQSAPEDGARVTSAVEVTIGGKPAEVREAVLMPGTVGVYLVKVVVPDGLETSTSTPLILTVDGQPSPTVTVATRAR
ncbi:MAG: hypothetical protein JNK87_11805 [Bryobacterales bacterium]|nr:hypothetical protein [Bryobacterales bacterium]